MRSSTARRVASLHITFDDGPDETCTPRVLEALRRLGAHATFFLIGERVQELPWIARLVADAGHEVALHCHRHVRHTDLDEAEIEADTRLAIDALAELGLHPTRWRAPWGICTPATVAVAERCGLELVHWTLDTHDWRGDTPAAMCERLAADPALKHGGIVLMHDGVGPGALRDSCHSTVELLAPLRDLAASRELRLGPLLPRHAQSAAAPPLASLARTDTARRWGEHDAGAGVDAGPRGHAHACRRARADRRTCAFARP